MHRRLAFLALVLGALAVLGACAADGPVADPSTNDVAPPTLHPRVDALPATTVRIARAADDGPVSVVVRVASTATEREQGLMGVRELPDGSGMLFVFDAERSGGFWMRDTLVALDIAFVGGDRRIAAILTMEPCVADPCPVHDPQVSYQWALEVPAGWFADQRVHLGDEVTWDPPAVPGGQ